MTGLNSLNGSSLARDDDIRSRLICFIDLDPHVEKFEKAFRVVYIYIS